MSELVETIAAVEGLDVATVTLFARYIREAGFIKTGGRGSSAAKMDIVDAANLLIGVNATTVAAEAPKVVLKYRALEAHEQLAARDPRTPQRYGTLGEAVEQLIGATALCDLPELFLNREVPPELQKAFRQGTVRVEVTFRKPSPSAAIKLSVAFDRDVDPSGLLSEAWPQLPSLSFHFYPAQQRSRKGKTLMTDRIEGITIGYRSLRAVGDLLHSQTC
jgi:hypothetical protein